MNFAKSICFLLILKWPPSNCDRKTVISHEIEDTQYPIENIKEFKIYEFDKSNYSYKEIIQFNEDYHKNDEKLNENVLDLAINSPDLEDNYEYSYYDDYENVPSKDEYMLNNGDKEIKVDDSTNTRIVGGLPTIQHEFPWMAALVYENENNKSLIFCGGSIISFNVIMTAAHCLTLMDHKGKNFCIFCLKNYQNKYLNYTFHSLSLRIINQILRCDENSVLCILTGTTKTLAF